MNRKKKKKSEFTRSMKNQDPGKVLDAALGSTGESGLFRVEKELDRAMNRGAMSVLERIEYAVLPDLKDSDGVEDLVAAEAELRRVLSRQPDDIPVRHRLARALLAKGDQRAAAWELHRILMQEPGNTSAQLDLAILLLPSGEYSAALETFDRVLKKDGTNEQALFYRAVVLDRMEKKNEALAIFESLARDAGGKYAQRAQQYIDEQELLSEEV